MIDSIPMSPDDLERVRMPPTSLQLRNTLNDTLCRMKDMEGLKKLFDSVDPNFQLKMFSKLPPIS